MPGAALILLGSVMIWWSRWYWPRHEHGIRILIRERGRSSKRFDAVFASNGFRVMLMVITAVSVLWVVTGVVLIAISD